MLAVGFMFFIFSILHGDVNILLNEMVFKVQTDKEADVGLY